jgi:glycosyltransferase involved in cell wall biosynthesis
VAELGLSDRVHFLGEVPDPAEHLRAADAFVLPSVAEGMSNSLLEAMATGLTCLASDIGGNTDLIEHGRTGLLLPPDKSTAWVALLRQVVEKGQLVRPLGQAARQRVEHDFALPAVVDRYLALYRRLICGESTNLC